MLAAPQAFACSSRAVTTRSPRCFPRYDGITAIRPMMYVPEQGVAHFVADQGIRVVKNTCPVDGSTKRAYAKQLIEQINRETPGAKERIMHAIMNGRFPDWPM